MTRLRKSPVLLALVLFPLAGSPLTAAALAQEPATAPVGAQRIELEALDGQVTTRPMSGFQTTDPRQQGGVFLRYAGLPEPEPPSGPRGDRAIVTLGNGDWIAGRIDGGEEERLDMTIHAGARLSFAIEDVFAVVFPNRLGRDGRDPEGAEEGDRIYLRRGQGLDKVDGLVAAFDADGVTFEGRFGERTYPWADVAAIFVEPLGEGVDEEPSGVPVVVDLQGSGRLSGILAEATESGVKLEMPTGGQIELPAAVVRELAVDDGSFRFLSQLELADQGPIAPFQSSTDEPDDIGMQWPPQMDKNVQGDTLRSGGRSWSRGIGVHAASRLTWALDGSWGEFRALAAIDDSALQNEFSGSVIFRVHVDGEKKWESPILRGGDTPLPLPAIDVSGAKELVLEVDPATELFVSDRANWLRPVLVKK